MAFCDVASTIHQSLSTGGIASIAKGEAWFLENMILPYWNAIAVAGGLLRTSTRPTLHLLPLHRAYV
jgi:hypothetical protein